MSDISHRLCQQVTRTFSHMIYVRYWLVNCIFVADIEYRNISIQKKKLSACAKPPYLILPPCIPSPLFCPAPCMPSPYSVPPYACPPPILSHRMHALPLFYPTPCIPSPYSIPAYTHLPPILFHPIHALPLFYPTVCMLLLFSTSPHMPPQCSIPAHACPTNSLSHEPGRHVSPLTSENALLNLLTLSLSSSFT